MNPSPRRLALAAFLTLASLVGATAVRAEEPPAPAAPPAAPPAPAAPAAAPAASGPRITLLEPGAEPRTKLRYAFAKGEPQVCEMRMELSQEMEIDGAKTPAPGMPGMGMTLRSTVEAVHEDGSATVLWEITEMKGETEGVAPEQAKVMEDLFAQMHFKVRSEMTDRGFVKSSEIELPTDVTGQAKQVLEQMAGQMKDSIGESAALLPEEAIGVGASWKVEIDKKTPQGIQMKATTLTSMEALTGGKASLAGKVSMEAPEQDFALPNMPAGKPAHLHTLTGEGTTKLTFDPALVLPDTEMHMVVAMKMALDPGTGKTMEMGMKQTIGVAMSTKR